MRKLEDELFEAIARGWCAPETSSKEMDVVLAEVIRKSILPVVTRAVIAGQREVLKIVEDHTCNKECEPDNGSCFRCDFVIAKKIKAELDEMEGRR